MHLWTFKNIIMLLFFYNYSWTSFCIQQMVYDLLAIGQKEVHVFRWLGFSFLWVSWKVICLMWDCTFIEVRNRKSKAEKGGIQTSAMCWKVAAEPWKSLGFLASGGEEFNPVPQTRLDCSELLCNKDLLKYKRDRENFWHRHQKGAERVPPR